MALPDKLGRTQPDLAKLLSAQFPGWARLLDDEDRILSRLAHAPLADRAAQLALAAEIREDLAALDGTPLRIYVEILLFRLGGAPRQIAPELRGPVGHALGKACLDPFRELLENVEAKSPGTLLRLAGAISVEGEPLGEALACRYAQLSPAERLLLQDTLAEEPGRILDLGLSDTLRKAAERKWATGLGGSFVHELRHASPEWLSAALHPRGDAEILELPLRRPVTPAAPDTDKGEGGLEPFLEGALKFLRSEAGPKGKSAQLPPSWLEEDGTLDVPHVASRMRDLVRRIGDSNDHTSTGNGESVTIEGLAAYIRLTPQSMEQPGHEAHRALIKALERQELEDALAQIRIPTGAAELAAAGAHVRWHLSNQLSESGTFSPDSALPPLTADLRHAATLLGSPLPESGEEASDPEVRLRILLGEQGRIEELREELREGFAAVDRAAKERIGWLLEREGALRHLTTSRISELRTGGMKYIERLREEGLSCIVHKQGASKDKALLIPYSQGMSYSTEVPFKELSQRGGKLLERAQAGEILLLVDKRSKIEMALVAPLSKEAEEYWSKIQP